MGWTIPWFSSFESDFNVDFGVSPETPQPDVYQDGESFGLSVFLRDSHDVYRTYFTSGRGVEALGSVWSFLDVTPLGRQEEWEDSPAGYAQTKPYEWWRRPTNTTPRDRLRRAAAARAGDQVRERAFAGTFQPRPASPKASQPDSVTATVSSSFTKPTRSS